MEQNQAYLDHEAFKKEEEKNRLKALERYDVHDEEFEEDFKGLLQVASALFKVPMVALSFMHQESVTLQTMKGLDPRSSPRKGSFCEAVQHHGGVLVIPDASKEAQFADNEYVKSEPFVRFYGGVALETYDNYTIGALQIMDTRARRLNAEEIKMLKTLARQIMNRLDVSYRFYDLCKARAFYQSLVDNLPESLCILRKNNKGEFTFGNKNFCKLIGKNLDEIVGKTDLDLYPEVLAKKYRADDEKVMNSKVSIGVDEINTDAQGDKRYVHVMKMPLFEPDNPYEVMGVQSIFWDETLRIEAEQELQTQKNLLQRLLDMSADCIYFKDKESRFIRVSQSMLRSCGLERQEQIVGKRDSDFFLSDHAQEALKEEQGIIESGVPIIGKVEHEVWSDGRESYALTNKAPLRDRDGEVIGTLGISKDITRLMKTEEELKKARDKALDATRLKSEFLANMSHEIRTPMNAIIGMSEQLGMTPLDLQQKEFLSYITTSANSLLAIINDILDFSKIEAGKLVIEMIDCSLYQTISDAVNPLARLADEKHVELLTHIDEDVPDWVQGAPERIRQILTNLIGNAIKFTHEGEVLLRVSVRKKTDKYTDVEFSVKDTGIGIPKHVIPKLFHAFSQADGSTTRKFGGTGLGLAICKQLTTLLKGGISVTSVPSEGSTFTFHLPFKNALHERAEDDLKEYPMDWLKGKSFLVVDDNSTNRQILRIHLESLGGSVSEACDGPAALELLESQEQEGKFFDFTLLDYQMPGMDGLELARRIHEKASLSKMKLILQTSVCSVQSQEVLNQVGICRFLVKPIRKQKLLECLASIFKNISRPEMLSQEQPYAKKQVALTTEQVHAQLRGMRILVAEDMELNQRVLLMQLEQLHHTAHIVWNGKQALEAVAAKEYDLVFMDCQMPGMDGYQATQAIRKMEQTPGYPHKPVYIVAMTANALEGDRDKCIQTGMNDYLSKPVRQNDLRDFLCRYANQDALLHSSESSSSVAPKPKTSQKENAGGTPPFSEDDFDMSTLETIRSLRRPGKPDPLAEAVKFFTQDANRSEQPLKDAVARGKKDEIRLYAHGLKGICMNLGAKRGGELFKEIEFKAREKEDADYAGLLQGAMAELERIKVFLQQFVTNS